MGASLKDILASIPKLTPAEIARVRSACAVAVGIGAKSAPTTVDVTTDDMWLLDAISQHMRNRGLDLSGPELLRKGRHYNAFREKVPAVFAFATGLKKQQREALLTIGIDLLREDLDKIGLAVSSRSLMAHAHRIPAVINRAFPGYAQNNMLHLITRGETRVRKK